MPNSKIRQINLENRPYDLVATYIQNEAGTIDWTIEDILSEISHRYEVLIAPSDFIKPDGTIDTEKYPPNEDRMNKIFLYEIYSEEVLIGSDEYIVIKQGTPATYRWELIGSSGAELNDYVKIGARTTSDDGKHTHGVTGDYTDTTYESTTKYLTVETEDSPVVDSISETTQYLGTTSVTEAVPADHNAIYVLSSNEKSVASAAISPTEFYAVQSETATVAKRADNSITIVPAKTSLVKPTRTVLDPPTEASKVSIGTQTPPIKTIQVGHANVGTSMDNYTPTVEAGVLVFNKTSFTPATATTAADNVNFVDEASLEIPSISATDVTVPVISSNADVTVAVEDTQVTFYPAAEQQAEVAIKDAQTTSIVGAVPNGTVVNYTFDSFDVAKPAAQDTTVATGNLESTGSAAVVTSISYTTDVNAITSADLSDAGTSSTGIKTVQEITETENTKALNGVSAIEDGLHHHTITLNHNP